MSVAATVSRIAAGQHRIIDTNTVSKAGCDYGLPWGRRWVAQFGQVLAVIACNQGAC